MYSRLLFKGSMQVISPPPVRARCIHVKVERRNGPSAISPALLVRAVARSDGVTRPTVWAGIVYGTTTVLPGQVQRRMVAPKEARYLLLPRVIQASFLDTRRVIL